jgi:exoribonuclease-2
VLVEFMEGGGLACGWVLNPAGARGRLEVRMEGGRAMALAPGRILTKTEMSAPEGGQSIDKLLAAVSDRRRKLASEVDLAGLWESLEGEGPEFGYELLAGLNFGREALPDDVSALIRAVHADGLWFEFSPEGAKRRGAEELEKVRRIRAREAARKAVKEVGAAFFAGALEGKIGQRTAEAEEAARLLKGFMMEAEDFKEAVQAKEILRLVNLSADSYGAFKALSAAGDISPDENIELLRLGRPLEFSEAVLAEAKSLLAGLSLKSESRLDLSGLFTVTVDSPGAKEFDDALSLEPLAGGGTTLWLHIADPASLIAAGSLSDQAAAQRAATVYLPETRCPMLPEALTDGAMSLVKNTLRPAFSLKVDLSPDGEPLSWSFCPSLVSVDLQISFPEAEQLLAKEGDGCALAPFLEAARLLAKRRSANGGQILKLPRGNVRLDPDGLPEPFLADVECASSLMVEEMMILANHLAARTLMEAGWPCPYRYQEKSMPRQWAPPPDAPPRVRLAADLAARRLIGRVGVTLEPSVHHGVGLGAYTSFTSPMRRYLDLAVARQLRALAAGRPPAYDREAMMALALDFEADYRAIRRLQNNRQRYWLLRLLAGKTGERFVGLVFERRGRKAKICLTDYMLEAELPSLPPSAEPGSDVLLRLLCAEPKILDRDETLSFEYLQSL